MLSEKLGSVQLNTTLIYSKELKKESGVFNSSFYHCCRNKEDHLFAVKTVLSHWYREWDIQVCTYDVCRSNERNFQII